MIKILALKMSFLDDTNFILAQTNKKNIRLALISLFFVSWIFTAFRVSKIMGKAGKSSILWFFITLIFSAIPAMILMWLKRYQSGEYIKDLSSSKFSHKQKRNAKKDQANNQQLLSTDGLLCPHCAKRIPEHYAHLDQCVYCKMRINKDNIA